MAYSDNGAPIVDAASAGPAAPTAATYANALGDPNAPAYTLGNPAATASGVPGVDLTQIGPGFAQPGYTGNDPQIQAILGYGPLAWHHNKDQGFFKNLLARLPMILSLAAPGIAPLLSGALGVSTQAANALISGASGAIGGAQNGGGITGAVEGGLGAGLGSFGGSQLGSLLSKAVGGAGGVLGGAGGAAGTAAGDLGGFTASDLAGAIAPLTVTAPSSIASLLGGAAGGIAGGNVAGLVPTGTGGAQPVSPTQQTQPNNTDATTVDPITVMGQPTTNVPGLQTLAGVLGGQVPKAPDQQQQDQTPLQKTADSFGQNVGQSVINQILAGLLGGAGGYVGAAAGGGGGGTTFTNNPATPPTIATGTTPTIPGTNQIGGTANKTGPAFGGTGAAAPKGLGTVGVGAGGVGAGGPPTSINLKGTNAPDIYPWVQSGA